MSDFFSTYLRGIHDEFDFYAAWPPGQPRRLGDVGKLVGGQFQPLTTLAALGISFATRAGPPGGDLSHTSGSNVSVQFKAKGEPLAGMSLPIGKAGALAEFSSAGAFVFQAAGTATVEIEDQDAIGDRITELFRDRDGDGHRRWNPDWCVIVEVYTADKVTILVSKSDTAKIELSADGALPLGAAPLASVSAGLSVVSQKGQVTSVLAAKGLTPMFRIARLRRSMLDRLFDGEDSASFGRMRGAASVPAAARALEDVPFEEAMNAAVATVAVAKRGKKKVSKKVAPAVKKKAVPVKKKAPTTKKKPAPARRPKPAAKKKAKAAKRTGAAAGRKKSKAKGRR